MSFNVEQFSSAHRRKAAKTKPASLGRRIEDCGSRTANTGQNNRLVTVLDSGPLANSVSAVQRRVSDKDQWNKPCPQIFYTTHILCDDDRYYDSHTGKTTTLIAICVKRCDVRVLHEPQDESRSHTCKGGYKQADDVNPAILIYTLRDLGVFAMRANEESAAVYPAVERIATQDEGRVPEDPEIEECNYADNAKCVPHDRFFSTSAK